MRFGYWMPIFGGWLRNVADEQMPVAWPYLRDLAVASEHAARLVEVLAARGYAERERESEWNFVLADVRGNAVDVHVFAFDEQGRLIDGIAYPRESLTGTGVIAGTPVDCIAPEWMFRFKTAYPPAPKDLRDVRALAERYGFEVPTTHRGAAS